MSDFNLFSNYSANYFLLRTPLLSANTLSLIYSSLTNDSLLAQHPSALSALFHTELFQEAIYIASPSLHQELIKFLNNELTNPKDVARMQTSLFRYLTRMATRCTPFGLFAGYSLGRIGSEPTQLTISSAQKIKKHIRLDMDYMCQFSNNMIAAHEPSAFSYSCNSSLYRVGSKLRYIETKFTQGNRKYHITHIDWNELLPYIIDFTTKEQTYSAIVAYIVEFGFPEQQAKSYVEELISAQVLTNSLEANVTGPEYIKVLVDKLAQNKKFESESNLLKTVINLLKDQASASNIQGYKEVYQQLKAITPALDEGKLFQLDMEKIAIDDHLNESIVSKIASTSAALAYLNNWQPGKSRLTAFKKKFEERYEGESVRLAAVLDAEIGIDYQSLVTEQKDSAFFTDQLSNFKLDKYITALKNGSYSITIKQDEIKPLIHHIVTPDSLGAMVRLYKDEHTDEDLLEFKYASGPSSARSVGRFCLSSTALNEKVTDSLLAEEKNNNDCIYAEIAHIPQARMGNVLARPHLRDYEIVFLSQSTLAQEKIIRIEDLYLKLVHNKLVLFSKKLKKEIIPRLTSAHNYANNNLQIYHFLADLQTQDTIPGIFWSWDSLGSRDFLPRVYVEDVLVSPAIWHLKKSHFTILSDKKGDELLTTFATIKAQLKMPDKVFLVDGDNELLLDLNYLQSLIIIQNELKKQNVITLKESLYTSTNLKVKDELGDGYYNEIMVPLTRNQPAQTSLKKDPSFKLNNSIQRHFNIGSEWVYFKLYTGISTADNIIRELIAPFAAKLEKQGFIDKYFFLRYADPDFHVRVRFHLKKGKSNTDLLDRFSKIMKPYLLSGEVSDLTLNTYKRELERYGVQTMEASESYFHLNSKFVISLLSLFKQTKAISNNDKLIIALKCVDSILNDFGLDINEKSSFYAHNRNLFAHEFSLNNNKKLKEQLQTGYRSDKDYIRKVLNTNAANRTELVYLQQLHDCLAKHSKEAQTTITQIKMLASNKKGPTLTDLLASYIHMFINRLFHANNRFSEFVIYEYLDKYSLSVKAQQKT